MTALPGDRAITMMESPHIIVVRRDHDFRIVETSRDFPFAGPVREEGRWLALEWWGDCFLTTFQGAVGHFPSAIEPGLFHLMLVQPGTAAPDRFVVCLRDDQYSGLGYDPFQAVGDGAFGFTRSFYESRGEHALHRDWGVGSGVAAVTPMTEKELALLRHAEQHLGQGTSVVVSTQSDSAGAPLEIARFARGLRPETRRAISICTFTNARSDRLLHFGPAFCALYSATMNRSLADVLAELVPLDEQGSPFKAIRRKSN